MSDEHDEKVPGVTLWLKGSSVSFPAKTRTFYVELKVTGVVHDIEVWNAVEAKFTEGFRVFTVDDFHMEVMGSMRDKIRALEETLAEERRTLLREKDARAQAEKELERYREPLSRLGQALRR